MQYNKIHTYICEQVNKIFLIIYEQSFAKQYIFKFLLIINRVYNFNKNEHSYIKFLYVFFIHY